MNVSFTIWALGALLSASPAVAEDAYYAIPLGELNVTDGELPERPQGVGQAFLASSFVPWNAAWNWPYATLDGEGEVYVGHVHEGATEYLVLRTSRTRKVTGRLFVPNSVGPVMAAVRFAVPAERASRDARLKFLQVKHQHYNRLAALGIPGTAWFGYQARQVQVEGGFPPDSTPVVWPGPMPFRRRPTNLAETYALFSGGRAVSENLQLDRVLPAAVGTSRLVPIDAIPGVGTREIDWQPLIAGLQPDKDPLAALVPADQYAIFFTDVEAAVKIGDLMSEGGTLFLRLAEPRVEDLRIIARYERQLGVPIRDVARLLQHVPVRSLAVTGSDLYFAQGTDIAVLLETPEPERVSTLLLAQVGLSTSDDAAVEWSQGQIGTLAFRGVRNRTRTRSSYVARLPGAVVVTNSLYQLGRLAGVVEDPSTSLAALPEYTFFRNRYARNDPSESALGILSDATIRRLCGPRWRIGDSRRTRDAAVMLQLQAEHLDELAAGKVHESKIEATVRRATPGSLMLTNEGVLSSTAGSLEFMTPIGELPLELVSQEEATAYDQWRRGYERNWTWAFDPIALRLANRNDGISADLTVMPLILQTQYRPLVSISEGVELKPQAGDPHDALAHGVLAINRQSELFQMGRNLASRSPLLAGFDPFGWIGPSLAVYADDDPFWKELADVSPTDRQTFLTEQGWRIPIGIQVEIENGLKLVAFLTSVRTLIDQAAAGMTQWETRIHRDEPYTRVSLTERGHRGTPGLDKAALYYAATGDALVVSPNEELLKRAIDRQIKRRQEKNLGRPSPIGKPWLGKSVGLQVDARLLEALVRFGSQEYQAMMQARAWGNLPILNEWKRRYADHDPIVLHQRLWQARLVCPGGGQYVWNDRWQTFESTVYGHPGEPKAGPAVPPALTAFASGNIGLTFEHQGLRVQLDLDRPATTAPVVAPAAEEASDRQVQQRSPDQEPVGAGWADEDPTIRQAMAELKSNPMNPEANFKLGRFLCVEKGDWQQGIPLLALGSQAAWRAAAEAELTVPATTEEFVRTGTRWWNLAQELAGPERQACLLRAGAWYREAAPALPPFSAERQDVAARRKTIEATGGAIPTLPARASSPAIALRVPPPPLRQNAAIEDKSTQDLRQLGLALHNYHDTFRTFPPACRSDQDGKPLLSWRVLVLPFLEQGALYDQFHLDEPWDSEHNRQLIAAMPAVFRSPASRAEPGKTNYLGVGGRHGIFPGEEGVRLRQITDGTSNTIAIVEVDDAAAIEWTRPGDFDPNVADLTGKLGGLRNGRFLAVFADGSTSMISSRVARATLNALFTRDGGEPVDSVSLTPLEFQSGEVDVAAEPAAAEDVYATEEEESVSMTAQPDVQPDVQPDARPDARPAETVPASPDMEYQRAVEEIRKLHGRLLVPGYKPCWSPDGARIAFSHRRIQDGVGIVHVATGAVTTLVAPGKDPAWSPDGKHMAYVAIPNGRDEEVWLVESTGANPRRLAEGGFPSWSSDGKTLFYQSRQEGRLKIMQSPENAPVVTDGIRLGFFYPAVSPDDQLLAFRWGNELVVVELATGEPRRRHRLPPSVGLVASFSPDGKRLGFGGWGGHDQLDMFLLDLETGQVARILSRQFTLPVWSPDGSKLTVDLRARTGWEIWLLDAEVLETMTQQTSHEPARENR